MPKKTEPKPEVETKESYSPSPDYAKASSGKYGKKNIWKWVVIYLIAAIVIYGIIYLLVINKGSSPYGY